MRVHRDMVSLGFRRVLAAKTVIFVVLGVSLLITCNDDDKKPTDKPSQPGLLTVYVEIDRHGDTKSLSSEIGDFQSLLHGAVNPTGYGAIYDNTVFVYPQDDRVYTLSDWNDDHYSDGANYLGGVTVQELIPNTKSNKGFYLLALEYWEDLGAFNPCQIRALRTGETRFYNTCKFDNGDTPGSAVYVKTVEEYSDDWSKYVTTTEKTKTWLFVDFDTEELLKKTTLHELLHQLSLHDVAITNEGGSATFCHDGDASDCLNASCLCIMNQVISGHKLLCAAVSDGTTGSNGCGINAANAIKSNLLICSQHHAELIHTCPFANFQAQF